MRSKKTIAIILALVLMCTLALTACNNTPAEPAQDTGSSDASSAPPASSPSVNADAPGGPGGTTTAGEGSDIMKQIVQSSLDYSARIQSEISDSAVSSKDTLTFAAIRDPGNLDLGNLLEFTLYPFATMAVEYFMRYDFATASYYSPVCESYEADPDYMGATFHIRPNIMMTDGNIFTAEDIIMSIVAFRNSSPLSWHVDFVDLDNAEIIDDNTLYLPFFFAKGTWESAMQMFTVISGDAYEASGRDVSFFLKPEGPMPYYLSDHVPGESMTLSANEGYYRGAPPIKKVTMRVISDRTAAFMALQNGDIDLLWNVSADQAQTAFSSDNLEMMMMGENMIAYLGMNAFNTALSDFRVRQAISLALNRQDIIDGAYDGLAYEAKSILTRESVGYDPAWDSQSTLPAQDIEKAKALMEEAGYGSGLTLRIVAESTINFQLLTEQLALQLGEIGITLDPTLTDYATMTSIIFNDDPSGYDLFMQLCQVSDDAISTLDNPMLFGASHPELSADGSGEEWAAIWAGVQSEPDGSKRGQLYRDANAFFVEKGLYWAPLVVAQTYVAMNEDLTGIRRNGFLGYFEDAYFR